MTFRQRLGMLRKERGYTQKTFAQELSVTERCIRAYENETRHPDYFGLIALADYFNVSLDYLVGRSDRRERNPYGRPLWPPAGDHQGRPYAVMYWGGSPAGCTPVDGG